MALSCHNVFSPCGDGMHIGTLGRCPRVMHGV